MSPGLRSPNTGDTLVAEDEGLLRDSDGRLWPSIDGIPFLRTGRDALAAEAAERQSIGDREGALVLLLADQDDWWTGASPREADLRRLVRDADRLSLRAAMGCLGYDRVGDYFAHRWSDPTYLAGLALLEAHWRPSTTAFELACGIGHYGRELARRGVRITGADVVFSKLWLARHWVLGPDATLVCFDAAAPWPVAGQRFDLAFCHDAFYFLEPKPTILAALRALAAPDGRIALSHVHNSQADNMSAGRGISPADVARLFPNATVYDDAELTRALEDARAPRPAPLALLGHVEAFSIEDVAAAPARAVSGGLCMPLPSASLRLNPLYQTDEGGTAIAWPSARYETEYSGRATYPQRLPTIDASQPVRNATTGDVRRRVLVDLPERW